MGAAVSAAHQSRCGSDRVSARRWCAPSHRRKREDTKTQRVHEGIACESGRRVAAKVSDFVGACLVAGRVGLIADPCRCRCPLTLIAVPDCCSLPWRPGTPAFWPCGPASPHRRGRASAAGDGCDRADGAPAACLVAGRAGSAPRGTRWERCQAPFRGEMRARHRARVLSTRGWAGGASQAQCQGRHAPGNARSCAGVGALAARGRCR